MLIKSYIYCCPAYVTPTKLQNPVRLFSPAAVRRGKIYKRRAYIK